MSKSYQVFIASLAVLGFPPLVRAETPRGLALFSMGMAQMDGWRLFVEGNRWSLAQTMNRDARWARLWATGLRLEGSSSEQLKAFASNKEDGRQNPTWVLLNPKGQVEASGVGLPGVLSVEEALRKVFHALPWETIERLIRDKPDCGEARLAQAELALAISAPWNFKDPRPMAQYENHVQLARVALSELLAVPAWPWHVDLDAAPDLNPPRGSKGASEILTQEGLEKRGAQNIKLPNGTAELGSFASSSNRLGPRLWQQAPQLQVVLRRMSEVVLAALISDPAQPRLQTNLAFLLRILDTDDADWLMGKLSEVSPLPGQEWPPLPLIHAQAEILRYRKRWPELLTQSQAWQREMNPLFMNAASWDRHLFRQGTLMAYIAMARSWREGWGMLPQALGELRKQSGSHYSSLARLALRWAYLPEPPSRERDELFRLAGLPSLPSPVMSPPFPAWQIEVRNPVDLVRLKEAFDRSPSLIQWLPAERLISQKPALKLAWKVSLGKERRGDGDPLPISEALADILSAGRPGKLWVASDRVGREPEAVGPRRFRIEYLIERMPCRALEPELAGDLSRALLGADLPVETLNSTLWFTEAGHAIPALEEHLRRWPMDGERWKAQAFWTTFLPASRGPVELAEAMPGFYAGLPFQLCLSPSIHAQVGNQLVKQKAWAALRFWFEPVWSALQALGPDSPQRPHLVRDLAPMTRSFLDASYVNLGLSGQRKALLEVGREMEAWGSKPLP